jgi:hypothetical protein
MVVLGYVRRRSRQRARRRVSGSGGEEVADCRRDLAGVRLQREVDGVEEADDRTGNVALERLRAGAIPSSVSSRRAA